MTFAMSPGYPNTTRRHSRPLHLPDDPAVGHVGQRVLLRDGRPGV